MLREPLLHFAVIGVVLFITYGAIERIRGDGGSPEQVRIRDADVEWLGEAWKRQWQRPPSADELRGLVTAFLREQVLAREARALGLDEEDVVVRRRLAQKVEFLLKDTAQGTEPSEAELQQFYESRVDLYREPTRLSFRHLYFDPTKRSDAAADARASLAVLAQADGEAEPAGDPIVLETEIVDADETAVAARFGSDFAREIFARPSDAWSGPITSSYGLHLVRVTAIQSSHRQELAEVRSKVLQDWQDWKQREHEGEYLSSLLRKYDVVMDERAAAIVGPIENAVEAK